MPGINENPVLMVPFLLSLKMLPAVELFRFRANISLLDAILKLKLIKLNGLIRPDRVLFILYWLSATREMVWGVLFIFELVKVFLDVFFSKINSLKLISMGPKSIPVQRFSSRNKGVPWNRMVRVSWVSGLFSSVMLSVPVSARL